jgi:hypothetical protein
MLSPVKSRDAAAITDHAIAFGWGFAEATAFFVVPDVWTTRIALRHPRRALASTVSATVGAVAGGAVVHRWASRVPPAESAGLLAKIPAIDAAMVAGVDAEVSRRGFPALMAGPVRGVPYKLYARSAAVQGLPLGGLIAWTVPARIIRFLAVTAGAGLLARAARRSALNAPGHGAARLFGSPERAERAAHLLVWAAVYTAYFAKVGRRHSAS